MYEVVKVVKGLEIKRRVGTRGYYTVSLEKGERFEKWVCFRTIKAAAEFCESYK